MARSRDEYEQQVRDQQRGSVPVAAAAPSIAVLLALQSSAGNQAVGRMLARRSPFKRRDKEPEPAPEAGADPAPETAEPEPVPAPAEPEPPPEPAAPGPPLIPTAQVAAKREQRAFASCEAARAWAEDNIEENYSYASLAEQPPPDVTIGERDGQMTASALLDFRLDPGTSYTKIVVPTWPDMTADERQEVDDYVNAIQAHEDGHIAVAEQAYAAMTAVVEGVGATEEGAGDDREAKAKERLAATGRYAAYTRDEYDALTDHGRKQSAVGGRDTVLNCPPRP